MRNIVLLVFAFALSRGAVLGQDTSHAKPVFSAYVDGYYGFYTDSVGDDNYQKFPSVSPRSSFGLNTAMLTAQYDGQKIRGIVTLHFGDVPRSTWSSTLNAVMEAHAGLRLCKKLWLDAGLFRTHFGTEGLLPRENFTSSVSVGTFYEPYYEAGARLSYSPNDKLAVNLYALNGYGLYEDNNRKKSIGLLVTYALGDKGNVGYSNYTGDDTPTGDSVAHLRIHNNVFVNYQIRNLKIQVGADYCLQQNADVETGQKQATMQSALASLKYNCGKNISPYARVELFNDPDGFMSGVIEDRNSKLTGLKLWGVTAGVEYKPTENSYLRLEGRQLQMDADQTIFRWDGGARSRRFEVTSNIGVWF